MIRSTFTEDRTDKGSRRTVRYRGPYSKNLVDIYREPNGRGITKDRTVQRTVQKKSGIYLQRTVLSRDHIGPYGTEDRTVKIRYRGWYSKDLVNLYRGPYGSGIT